MQSRVYRVTEGGFGSIGVEPDKEPGRECGCEAEKVEVAPESVMTRWVGIYLSHESRNIVTR